MLNNSNNNSLIGRCNARSIACICIALAVITLSIYIQAGNHQFLSIDDEEYVTNNHHVLSGVTSNNIVWALTSVDKANWHPLTWMSHMADAQLYGVNPRGHHLTSVVIHTISSLLLLLLLFRMTGSLWQSSFVAALFALHPLHVESVAWIAERKDVLSALFWFIALFFYVEYVAKRKSILYILSLLSFVLGLMSKPMIISLPIIMLLMDFWPLDRYRHNEQEQGPTTNWARILVCLKEKIPFFACSVFSAVITIYAQNKGGAIKSFDGMPFELRAENALVAYVKYIIKTFWPHDLAVLYPIPASFPLWQVIGSILILVLLSIAAIHFSRRHPYLLVGWLWFLITLVPVIGLIQVGNQSMADRYSYIPAIGLFIIAAWGVPSLTKELQHRTVILSVIAGAIIIASAALTWQQLGYWRDSISLYQHTLEATSDNYLIHFSLGAALTKKGDLDGAIKEYQDVLQICPTYTKALINLGVTYARKGQFDAAIQEYEQVLRINPNETKAHNNLGLALAKKGNLDEAIQELYETLRINPNDSWAHNNLDFFLAQKKAQEEARK